MENIYFDNGSTAFPKAPGVAQAVSHLLEHGAYNINRGGYSGAYETASAVFETREMLAEMFDFGHDCKNVVFTPNITFALNYIVKGWLKAGDHVIVSSLEHNALMRPLCQCGEVCFDAVQTDACGVLNPAEVEALIKPNTRAVIMTGASNVCGTILPIAQIGKICRGRGLRFILDSAQLAGVFDISMKQMNIDALCFTGHKGLLGPQGIGGMLIDPAMAEEMTALVSGGTGSLSDSEEVPKFMPDKLEPGTANLPGIIGLRAALEFIKEVGTASLREHELSVTQHFLQGAAQLSNTRIVGLRGLENRTALVSLDFLGRDNAEISYALDSEHGIMTRCGMHCAPRAHKSLGTYPQGTVRFSFGRTSTKEQVDICIEALKKILK